MNLKLLDYAAVALVTAGVVASGVWVYRPGSGRPVIQVESSEGRQYLALGQDASLRVTGPLGVTGVEVHAGRVHIDHSPCANQQCVRMGWLGPEGGWVACLPNRVFVRVKKGAMGGVIRVRTAPEQGGPDARIW